MEYLKRFFKCLLITFLAFIVFSLILTALNYFNVFNHQILEIIKIIIPILSLGFGGLLMGRKALKNGWLEGLKIGVIIVLFLICLTVILGEFEFSKMTFFLILIMASIFGSILGINVKNT